MPVAFDEKMVKTTQVSIKFVEEFMFSRWLTAPVAIFVILVLISLVHAEDSSASNQEGCIKDTFGRIYCAPAGGAAVIDKNTDKVVCAPGKCITDSFGRFKCSREANGGAAVENSGKVVCVGGCISPSREFCVKPK